MLYPNEPKSRPDKSDGGSRVRSYWPCFVVALLVCHVTGMLWVVIISQRNKPPVIENYYEKAVNWDRDHGRLNR
ncbi:MAG: hypothetical protein KatS3mg104_1408 [Phycisphaerae bacterium]|jgi:hypothetical protein|nr:MAG: hypothetical protein KatS3mg104_1408 [Phycisphaerae bacterium]